jgi:hypothetical protein
MRIKMPCLCLYLMFGWTKSKYWKNFTPCFLVGLSFLSSFFPFPSFLLSLSLFCFSPSVSYFLPLPSFFPFPPSLFFLPLLLFWTVMIAHVLKLNAHCIWRCILATQEAYAGGLLEQSCIYVCVYSWSIRISPNYSIIKESEEEVGPWNLF